MNEERAKSIMDRAKTLLETKMKQAQERRLYGDVTVQVKFENGVPQIGDCIEKMTFRQ